MDSTVGGSGWSCREGKGDMKTLFAGVHRVQVDYPSRVKFVSGHPSLGMTTLLRRVRLQTWCCHYLS